MKITTTKCKEYKVALYCAGCFIIMSIWFALRPGEMLVFDMLRFILLIILSYAAMIFDINTKRIPNTLILIMITGWLLLMIPMMFIDTKNGIDRMVDSLYGLLTGGGLFLLVYMISSKGLGGGDVKFIAAAGLYLGFAKTIPAIFCGTLLAALTGLALIILRKIKRKDKIPLAPFLFTGILLTIIVP